MSEREIVGRQFGRYRVVSTLGRGAMGEVFAAVDDVLGREVAIKTLRGVHGELGARLLDERFRHEARAIAALTHPGVVQVFDVDVTASPPFLVMERVAGPSLAARLDDGPLPIDQVRGLGVQIARALAAAHDRGIVHRDVKPGNILAADDGRWKLADFGVAHVPDSSLTLTGQFIGSPAYAAPEALTRGELGPPGDVYGLGAVLYQAASGRWPRSEPSSPGIAGLLAPPPSLRGLAPHVPPELAAAIERALALEPSERPTAAAFARALAGDRDALAAVGAGASAGASASASAADPGHAIRRSATATPTAILAPMATPTPGAMGHTSSSPWPQRVPWIAAAVALVVGIAIGVGRRGGSSGIPAAGAPDRSGIASGLAPLGAEGATITATPPPGLGGKSAKDWNKITEKLYAGDFPEARHKLDDFERKYEPLAESANLAAQLDALGIAPRGPPGPPGRGRGPGKHDDD